MKIISTIVNGFTEKYGYPNLFDVMTEFIKLRNLLYERRSFGLILEPDTVIKTGVKTTWSEDQVTMALTAKTIGEMAQVVDDNAYELEINEEDPIEIYNTAFIELVKSISEYDALCFGNQMGDIITSANNEFYKIVYQGDKVYHVMLYIAEELNIDSYDDIKILQYIRNNFDEVMAGYAKYESNSNN